MDLIRPSSFSEFASLAEPFLLHHEAEHGLLLGVIASTANLPGGGFAGLVMDGAQVVALGLRKDDRLLLSHEARPGAITLIAGADDASLLDRVLGPPASVATAAGVIPRAIKQRLDQRIYENRKVAAPAKLAAGDRRLARPADVPKLAEWLIATLAESESEGDGMARGVAESAIARQVATGQIHVWDHDDEIVSSAAAVGPTRRAIRVNFVYTPPSLRRRGYATSLVASVTETLLHGGREFVFLHTDLANPTSNGIYQRIGYEQVGEFSMVRFEPRRVLFA